MGVGVDDIRHRLVVGQAGLAQNVGSGNLAWYLPTWVSNRKPVTSPMAHRPSPRRACGRRPVCRGRGLEAKMSKPSP